MEQTLIFWVIVGMCVVSYLPRMLPMQLLRNRELHPLITAWLRLIPAAVLPAILLPMLLTYSEGGTEENTALHFGFDNIFLWAALICLPFTVRFRSLSLPVVLGMMLIAAARYFGI